PGEGSLHPRPEGRGIRDPLHSRSNKMSENEGKSGSEKRQKEYVPPKAMRLGDARSGAGDDCTNPGSSNYPGCSPNGNSALGCSSGNTPYVCATSGNGPG
ncbi:MAG TPA: hypothetical protein VN455_07890, partial [Methanotrichaceae archaeon]|nr:hypothetical protein [Methanotrichaceae archaeon]